MWSRRKSDVRMPKLDVCMPRLEVRMPKPDVHRDISLLCEGIGLKARMRPAPNGRIALLFLFIYKESGCE